MTSVPIFEILSDFKYIQLNHTELRNYEDSANVIPELKRYELSFNWGTMYLHEWKGKLQEVNYQLKNIDDKESLYIAKFLFEKYGKGMDWIEEGHNPWGRWFELSDRSIKGFNVYSQGYRTISFSSFEKLNEETKIKYKE